MKMVLYIILMGITYTANACKCRSLTTSEKFHNADSVFIANLVSAKVVSPDQENQRGYVEGTLRVTDVFKGKPGKEIKVRTGLGSGDCGLVMTVSLYQKYIIYKGKDEHIGMCSGSNLIRFQEKDLINDLIQLKHETTSKNK